MMLLVQQTAKISTCWN